MHGSDWTLIVCDRHRVLRDTDIEAFFKRWLHHRGRGMSVLRSVNPEVLCPFDCSYKEDEYEKVLFTLVQRLGGSCYQRLMVRR